ncbi:hypothetical protein ED733_004171 [Metarhizium rileyi]|uniref:Uncharacterized protein n=1 Tax=Metarhizium rileyi (strain RCEF 4871) TaxID=1649241 RepID=A0A5C6G6N6_METRR|nr:hypothetical protein ED733_004171 [Metarhizium rileyi]
MSVAGVSLNNIFRQSRQIGRFTNTEIRQHPQHSTGRSKDQFRSVKAGNTHQSTLGAAVENKIEALLQTLLRPEYDLVRPIQGHCVHERSSIKRLCSSIQNGLDPGELPQAGNADTQADEHKDPTATEDEIPRAGRVMPRPIYGGTFLSELDVVLSHQYLLLHAADRRGRSSPAAMADEPVDVERSSHFRRRDGRPSTAAGGGGGAEASGPPMRLWKSRHQGPGERPRTDTGAQGIVSDGLGVRGIIESTEEDAASSMKRLAVSFLRWLRT